MITEVTFSAPNHRFWPVFENCDFTQRNAAGPGQESTAGQIPVLKNGNYDLWGMLAIAAQATGNRLLLVYLLRLWWDTALY
jgi:hypothetical protein